jgi:excinuclease ABC subunit B
VQAEHNLKHNIIPKTIYKEIIDIFDDVYEEKKRNLFESIGMDYGQWLKSPGLQKNKLITQLQGAMNKEAKEMNFDKAVQIRDFINEYHQKQTSVS